MRKSSDNEGQANQKSDTSFATESTNTNKDGEPIYHELSSDAKAELEQEKKDFRRHLNKQAREIVKNSIHEKIKMIVHRPNAEISYFAEYNRIVSELNPVIEEMMRKIKPILEHEVSDEYTKSKVYGTKFNAERIASPDYRYFSKKSPPQENPSLVVALRIFMEIRQIVPLWSRCLCTLILIMKDRRSMINIVL